MAPRMNITSISFGEKIHKNLGVPEFKLSRNPRIFRGNWCFLGITIFLETSLGRAFLGVGAIYWFSPLCQYLEDLASCAHNEASARGGNCAKSE
jgi:hypothetical protein